MSGSCAVQLLCPTVCDSYNVGDMRKSAGKRRRAQPAVRKQTTAAFLVALADGDVKTAQLLLDSSLSVSATDRLGRTALHLATCLPSNTSSQEICHTLLERLSDINKGDLFGMSPFFYAVNTQNLPMVSAMLPLAKVDKCDKFGNTTLHHAAATGNIFTVTAISKVTEKINKTNILGFTPLMIASKLGHVDCAKILAKHGAVSGTIRDMHCYLTAEDWARFSHRFTEADLRELKLAEKHYRDQAQTPSLLRSEHPDCKSRTSEVYRTTSRTIPLSVESTDRDQTQLMIKRVILLRKLSEFFNSSGKRLQVRGHVYESKLDIREKNSGNVKSISVNDLLDQHLSKLTLGGMKNSTQRKVEKKPPQKVEKLETQATDYNSDDSMLIRQAKVIEKGHLVARKQSRKRQMQDQEGGTSGANYTTREPLEPSIVTLVHHHTSSNVPPRAPVQTPRSSVNSRESSSTSSPIYKINMFNDDSSELYQEQVHFKETMNAKPILDPVLKNQPISKIEETSVKAYLKSKNLDHKDCSFYTRRYTGKSTRSCNPLDIRSRMGGNPLDIRSRMGGNPLDIRLRQASLPQHNAPGRKKKRIRSKFTDPADGAFGPWITDREKSLNETFIKTVGKPPQIKIDLSK